MNTFEMPKRTVWTDHDPKYSVYVSRCSRCGGYKEDLKEHWFYTGVYCVPCIRFGLYDDTDIPYNGAYGYES